MIMEPFCFISKYPPVRPECGGNALDQFYHPGIVEHLTANAQAGLSQRTDTETPKSDGNLEALEAATLIYLCI